MAFVLCVTCGLLAGAAGWVAVGADSAGATRAWVRAFGHGSRRMLESLASSRVVELAEKSDSILSVARELMRRLPDGTAMSQEEASALVVTALATALLCCGLASRSLVGLVAPVPVAVAAIRSFALHEERRRRKALTEEMPTVFRELATALESGNTLVQAIDYVGLHERGPAAEAFAHASLGLRCGLTVDEVLDRLSTELDAPGIELLATALSISQRTGSPLKSLFQQSATLVERQEELERTLAVRTAQTRLSVRVVCGLPLVMVCVLSLISPDFQQGLTTPSGTACLAVAAAMDGLALVLIRRIVDGVM